MRRLSICMIALAVLASCRGAGSARLADVPAQAALGAVTLGLEAEAWRNQMPGPGGPGANDQGLLLTVRVKRIEGAVFASDVRADSAWVVQGSETWATALAEHSRDPAGRAIEAGAAGGPRWEPKSTVDVVVSIRDGSGHRALVASRKVEIVSAQ